MNTKRTAKVALATFGLSVMLPTAAFAATDTQGHWAGSVLAKWESQALISGYEDGTIRPDHEISRAEFVALVNRVAGYQAAGSTVKFSDVKTGDWYAGQVAIAVNEGYIGGFEDNTFRPNDSVTRAQAAAIIARIKNLPSDTARANQFADAAATPDWAKGVVGAVANAGYMIGDEANNFNAEKALTRAEAVASLDRVFGVKDLAAQTLTLSATEGVIAKGASKTITATSSVEGAVITAVSSDTDVATVTVKDGKVTIKGVEKGSATITVTAKADGYKIATATYTVDVTAAGGAGGGGGSSSGGNHGNNTPSTDVNAGEVDVSDGVIEGATEAAAVAVNNILKALDAGADSGDKVEALTNAATSENSSAVTKVAANAAAKYLTENPNATDEEVQKAAEDAVETEVKAAAEEVEKTLDAATESETKIVSVEVPAILEEVAETITIAADATSKKTAAVGSYTIDLEPAALEDLEVTLTEGNPTGEISITVGDVLSYVDAGHASVADDVLEVLNARKEKSEALVTGTATWKNGYIAVNWESSVASLTDAQANAFMKNFGITFE